MARRMSATCDDTRRGSGGRTHSLRELTASPYNHAVASTPAVSPARGPTDERRTRERRRGLARRQADVPWATAPRVLLIAANMDGRLTITGLLEEAGYAVYAVHDAVEALQTIGRRLPDAVVLGEGSSGVDSLALLNALRTDASTSDVPAVILTGVQVHSGPPGRDRHTGPTMLLREPVSADSVVAAVDDLTRATPPERVARRQLRRTLVALHATERRVGTDGTGIDEMRAVVNRLHPAVLALDIHGALVAASRGAERLTGYTRDDLARMTVFDTAFGVDLPLARIWQAHTEGRRAVASAALRDHAGRMLRVEMAVGPVLPGLDALALAVSPT
jgi:PAS domain S-box-containing protein